MQPFVGQILLFAFPRAPDGWALCDGSLLDIGQFNTLFTLIGTTYGGDGVNTFAVPDLRGRVPLHQGQGSGLSSRNLGEHAGTETVTLTNSNLASHSHSLQASPSGASPVATPGPTVEFATATGVTPYAPNITGATAEVMASGSIGPAGGDQPHNNMMPTTIMNYCIALFGEFPAT